MLASFVISFIIILPQLIPTLNFIKLSARAVDQINWQKDGWFLPIQHLVQFVSPDFFGNPTTLNYWGTWNYGELTAFVGIPALILSIFAIFFRRDKKTYFFLVAIIISLIFAVQIQLQKFLLFLILPFLSTAQPTRLIFIIDFSLSILAAFGLNYLILKGKLKQTLFPIILVGFMLIGIFLYIQNGLKDLSEIENLLVARRNLILPILIFISSTVLLILITISKNKIKNFFIFVFNYIGHF